MPSEVETDIPRAQSVAWGFGAGLVGSLCCVGPAAAGLLGLGASSAVAGIQLGQAPALALGLATLLVGALFAARRGARCGLSGARRALAPLLMLAVAGIAYAALALALPAVAARQIAAAVQAAPALPGESELRRLTLSIPKMDCPPCVAIVQRRLAEQPGVAAFVAVLEADEVTIDYQPGVVAKTALAQLFPPSYGVVILDDKALP
jgi:copper chaperone CopZ